LNILLGALAVTLLLIVALLAGLTGAMTSRQDTFPASCAPPGRAVADIPGNYLALYRQAAAKYGVPWEVLAAIGKAESDHGRSRLPGIRSGENHAGAGGPMQFLSTTWRTFGVDGDHDGRKDRYNPADAIPAAARYLKHNGAPKKLRTALFRYNHSHDYVTKVLAQARAYAKAPGATAPPAACTAPALPANAVAAKVVAYAHAQLGKPYVWGAEGPDAFDCSGLTFAAYRAAGITLPRVSGDQWKHTPHIPKGQEQPGDLVFFNSGPGTSPDNPGHVGIVIAPGKMIAAPHRGTVVQIQSYNRRTLIGFSRPTTHR
jgi:cell wall-associated NlpC family hydrolase